MAFEASRSLNLRVLHFSPSTATGRHDSHRASLAFVGFARQAMAAIGHAGKVELVWALPAITSKEAVHQILTTADLLVLASPTYAQGSPWFVRRFLELGAGLQLWGGLATAFATAGGQHTGGEVTVADTLRSFQGMGLCTFTFAQKYVVFGAQQKFARDGEFQEIDVWFLRQLAYTSVAQLVGRSQPGGVRQLATRFGLDTGYYNAFPSLESMRGLVGDWVAHLNAPLSEGNSAYNWWTETLGFDAAPPDATQLPFFNLLPAPVA